jgi:CubicO group peptidase (beta-lactamase class C family)
VVHGEYEPRFEAVANEFAKQLAKRKGGAAVCAYYGGDKVVDVWGGVRDETGAPWERDTMCVSYSTTKGVVSTALHMLVDEGKLDYDDAVAEHWPEFAQAGKGSITIRQVMSHRAGLFNIRDLIDDATRMLDWEHMVEALAAAPAQSVPEGASAYQALTYGYIVGELIRRTAGISVSEFVRTRIAEPLGVTGLHIGATEQALERAARLVGTPARKSDEERREVISGKAKKRRDRIFKVVERVLKRVGHPVDFKRAASALAPKGISTFDFSSDEALRACIPAANGLFDARSLARMYAALANGGSLDGVRLLSQHTVDRATEIQTHGYDQITIFKMRWRLGYHRVATFRGVPKRAFGHFGWGGSGGWADPTRNISLAFVTNTGSGTPIGDMRIMRLNTRMLECVKKARNVPARAARAFATADHHSQ